MKAILKQLLQTSTTSTKGSSPLVEKKGEKTVSLFSEVLKKAVRAEVKGKNEKPLKEASKLSSVKLKTTLTEESSRNFKISFKEEVISLGKKSKAAYGKKEKTEIDSVLLVQEKKEATPILLGQASTEGIAPSLLEKGKESKPSGVPQKSDITKIELSIEGKKEPSMHLVRLQNREILTSVEDLRTKADSRKGKESLAQGKKLASFEKELKTSAPKPAIAISNETLDSPNFFTSESRLSSSQVLTNNLRKEVVSADLQFWNEWEAKVEAQIVDKARIILKDGGKGEIQLRLYPEKLGSVRVRLDVEGAQVFARFIVDNAQVKQVFEANSAAFQESLEQSGLNVSLDFSTSGEGSDANGDKFPSFGSSTLGFFGNETELMQTADVTLSSLAESTIDMMI